MNKPITTLRVHGPGATFAPSQLIVFPPIQLILLQSVKTTGNVMSAFVPRKPLILLEDLSQLAGK
jgi:hypothetical protein